MYQIESPAVYVTERAYSEARNVARLERMLKSIHTRKIMRVTDDELNRIIERENLLPVGRTGYNLTPPGGDLETLSEQFDSWMQSAAPVERVLVFDAFKWRSEEEIREFQGRYPSVWRLQFLGPWTFRDKGQLRRDCGGVCQSAYEFHCAEGCLHGCRYCFIGGVCAIMLNLEEYLERLDDFIKTIPWLKLFKYDNRTDQICLEPEYGASELMVSYFGRLMDQYLLLYTKSGNVDHLLSLPHNGHTIINWSMSCDKVARDIELRTPSIQGRIEAAQKCQNAGYVVRARFSPIVPIIGWQEEYARAVEEYLKDVRPDVITLDVLGWMTPTMMTNSMEVDGFDPEFRDCVKDLVRQGDPRRGKPYNPDGKHVFPPELRARIFRFMIDEIRKHRPEQRITICMETPEMWDQFGPELEMSPEDYVCCCGPTSVPGNPLLCPDQ